MLKKTIALFAQVVERIEGSQVPLARYVQLFFAILSVRLALEFFSSHRLFSLADVVHIGLWFIFIVLAFLLQLHFFSKEDIRRVTRLAVVGFTIALSAPILDLLISGGQGAKMNYLSIHDWKWTDLLFSYLSIGGASLSRGATLGIRIEIVLLLIAAYNYVHLKTASRLRAALSSWVIYTVLYISGTVPHLLARLNAAFDLHHLPEDQSTILLLLCLDLALISIVLLRHSPALARTTLRHANWPPVLNAVLLFSMGACLAYSAYPGNWSLHPTTIFHFPLLLGISLAFGLYTGLIAGNSTARPRNALLLLLLIAAYAVGTRFFFVVAVIWGLMFLLAEAPLLLRKAPLLRELLWAMAMLASMLAGFVAFGGPMVGLPAEWIGAVLAVSIAVGACREASPDLEDFHPAIYQFRIANQRRISIISAILIPLTMTASATLLFDIGTGILLGSATLPAAIAILFFPKRPSWPILWMALPLFFVLAKLHVS